DYALEIQQGNEINYSRQFSLSGGSSSVSATIESFLSSHVGNVTVTPNTTMHAIPTGAGVSQHRNTTMSRATLTPYQTDNGYPSPTGTGGSHNGGSASTGSQARPAQSTGGANALSGSMAMVVCAFASVIYFN